MKLRIVTLDHNDRIWDMQEVDAQLTKTGKMNAKTLQILQWAIFNMNSKFIYTVHKIEIYRVED